MFFHFAARMEEKLKYKNEKGRGGFFHKKDANYCIFLIDIKITCLK